MELRHYPASYLQSYLPKRFIQNTMKFKPNGEQFRKFSFALLAVKARIQVDAA